MYIRRTNERTQKFSRTEIGARASERASERAAGRPTEARSVEAPPNLESVPRVPFAYK